VHTFDQLFSEVDMTLLVALFVAVQEMRLNKSNNQGSASSQAHSKMDMIPVLDLSGTRLAARSRWRRGSCIVLDYFNSSTSPESEVFLSSHSTTKANHLFYL